MSPLEARKLKIGDRVVWHGEPPMAGKVEWNGRSLCTILWSDGSRTITKHDRFEKIECIEKANEPD